MEWLLFNDKNLSVMEEEQVKGYMMLREEVIIRLFTKYGCIDLSYDNTDEMISDYAKIRGAHNYEKTK